MKRLFFIFVVLMASLQSLLSEAKVEEKKSFLIRPQAYKVINDAKDLLDEKAFEEARKKLVNYLPWAKYKDYERALVLQLLAYSYIYDNSEAEAISYLRQAAEIKEIPDELLLSLKYTLGQLLFRLNKYEEVVALFANPNDTEHTESKILLGHSFYRLNRYREASTLVSEVVATQEQPKEAWMQLLLAIYYKQEDFTSARSIVLKLLNTNSDNNTYWLYFSNIAQILGKHDEAIAALEILLRRGQIKDENITQLANLYRYRGNPVKAAMLLENSQSNQASSDPGYSSILIESWLQARELEKSLPYFNRMEQSLDNRLRKAEVMIQLERWSEAKQVLAELVKECNEQKTKCKQDKEGEFEPDKFRYLLGIAAFYDSSFDLSKKMFASLYSNQAYATQAQAWFALVDEESKGE